MKGWIRIVTLRVNFGLFHAGSDLDFFLHEGSDIESFAWMVGLGLLHCGGSTLDFFHVGSDPDFFHM